MGGEGDVLTLVCDRRAHGTRRLLLRAFEAWKEEWWTTRRGWRLVVRAECHHK